MNTTRYDWEDIPARLPRKSGLYAWYSTPTLSSHDIDNCALSCAELIEKGDEEGAARKVYDLLTESLLRRSMPPPYQVDITGELMPRFQGDALFTDSLDRRVLLNMAKEPERIRALKDALRHAAPYFVAPLYIGMSKDLHQRLGGHKSLIQRGTENPFNLPTDFTEEDKCFASEIKRRGIPSSSLFVHVLTVEEQPSFIRDVEYILNRSTFPILGRR